MPPKEAHQARKKSSDTPQGEPNQQLQKQTSSPFLILTDAAGDTTKTAPLINKPSYIDQPTDSDTKATSLSLPNPTTHPESSSVGVRKAHKSQRLACSVSTALSPTLSSSAKAASKPIPRGTTALALPAATLSSSGLVALESSSSTEKIKITPLGHRAKTPGSASNIQSQPLEDLGALQSGVVDGGRASNQETDIEVNTPHAVDSERLPAISMSEAPAVLPLRSNCYRLEFGETIYKYEIVCEPSNVLAKREKRLVEKAFLEELYVGHQKGSIAFIDGHTFLTSKLYHGLENYTFVGTINRRLEKPDRSFRPIFLKRDSGEAGKVTKMWSSFVKGTCLDDVLLRKSMFPGNEEANIGSQLIAVRALAEVEEFDPANLCSLLSKAGSQSQIARFTEALGCLISRGIAGGGIPTLSNPPSLVVHGSRVFDFTWPGHYLGYGLDLRSGANNEIRATPEKLLRAVIPCYRIFYSPITVSKFIDEHLPGSVFTSTEAIVTIRALLRGLKVRIQRSNGEARIATVSGIARTTPAETFFDLRNADGCRVISVFDYFTKNRGISVTHPNHPCLIVGSEETPQFFPASICEIVQGQSFRHLTPKGAVTKVNEFTSISTPKANQSSGLTGDQKLVNLISEASSFGALSLHDGEAGHLSELPEQVGCQKVIKPTTHLPLTSNARFRNKFRVAFVALGNAPALSKTVEVFVKIFRRKLLALKLNDSLSDWETHTLKQSASVESWQKDLEDILNPQINLETSDAACGGSIDLPPPFIIALIEGGHENQQLHSRIKHLCDLRLGFQSCCVNLSTLEKIHQQNTDNGIDRYACSLLRKMFAKLENGLDDKDPDSTTVAPTPNATLLVGAHVVVVPVSPTVTTAQGVDDGGQVYCITLSSKPIGSGGMYKTTTMLKTASSPESLRLSILLIAHLDEHEKHRVQLSTLSRLVFYRSGFITPNKQSTYGMSAPSVDLQTERRLPKNANLDHRNSSPAPRGRAGSLMTGPSDSQQTRLRNEAQSSRENTEGDDVITIAAANGPTRRFAENRSQGRYRLNYIFSRPLSTTPSLPPYVETDPPERHNRFWETAERESLFQKETERLESAITSRYPCARLFYISVSSNTKLRLYKTTGQPLVKGPPGPDKMYNNVSWIASDGVTNSNDNEWFMLKELTGATSQKPLQLRCHNMVSSGKVSSLENNIRKNYEDTFDASYDYPPGLGRSKMVAPVYFARLATKRALLLMDRNDHTSDTAPYKLRPVNAALRDTLYYI